MQVPWSNFVWADHFSNLSFKELQHAHYFHSHTAYESLSPSRFLKIHSCFSSINVGHIYAYELNRLASFLIWPTYHAIRIQNYHKLKSSLNNFEYILSRIQSQICSNSRTLMLLKSNEITILSLCFIELNNYTQTQAKLKPKVVHFRAQACYKIWYRLWKME